VTVLGNGEPVTSVIPKTSNAFTPSLLLDHTVRRFGQTTKKAWKSGLQ
jgi:hypothetical protein